MQSNGSYNDRDLKSTTTYYCVGVRGFVASLVVLEPDQNSFDPLRRMGNYWVVLTTDAHVRLLF